jgi:hypothetical protein
MPRIYRRSFAGEPPGSSRIGLQTRITPMSRKARFKKTKSLRVRHIGQHSAGAFGTGVCDRVGHGVTVLGAVLLSASVSSRAQSGSPTPRRTTRRRHVAGTAGGSASPRVRPLKDLCGGYHFSLAFQADRSDESSCANQAQKKRIRRKINMTNAETNDKAAAVAEQGAHVAPEKASPKKGASQKKGGAN